MKEQDLKALCFRGFVIRIIALIATIVFSNNLTTGYLRSDYLSDDLRYSDGALYYAEHANSIVDINTFVDAFLSVNDNTGLSSVFALWYWMMCLMTYVVGSTLIVKIINILFGVTCIGLIYKLCQYVYPNNNRIAEMASKLYAYLPYPVFFSCFLYKDQFLTLVLLAIFFVLFKYDTILKLRRLLMISLLLFAFTSLRSGLLPILLLIIGYVEITKNRNRITRTRTINIILVLSGSLVLAYYLYEFYSETILHKLDSYVGSRESSADLQGSTIQYVMINNIWDIWKLPFAYMFTIIQPLYTGGKIFNWEHVVGILNASFLPVAIGNFAYFIKNKSNKVFWLSVMALFSIMLFVSLGIGRHYFYLLPYVMIFYADYLNSNKIIAKTTNKIGYIMMLIYLLFMLPLFLFNI